MDTVSAGAGYQDIKPSITAAVSLPFERMAPTTTAAPARGYSNADFYLPSPAPAPAKRISLGKPVISLSFAGPGNLSSKSVK